MGRPKKVEPPITPYVVYRDSGEHDNHGWFFPESGVCAGTVEQNLWTGDYSLDGCYEDKYFIVERKGSVAELVANLTQKEKWRCFKDELQRMEEFRFPFVICEFPYSLLERYPVDSGIPKERWDDIRVTPKFLMKRLWEIQLTFKTKWLFADQGGEAAATSLFKRIMESRSC
jgi:hypothetical protein